MKTIFLLLIISSFQISSAQSTDSIKIRFDGIYQGDKNKKIDGNYYYRFYEDGTVISESKSLPVKDFLSTFKKENYSETYKKKGKYEVNNQDISFRLGREQGKRILGIIKANMITLTKSYDNKKLSENFHFIEIHDTAFSSSKIGYTTITDFDSNLYETVKMWDHVWLKSNLIVKHYRNGDPLIMAQTKEEWADCLAKEVGAWCYSYNRKDDPDEILYNWFAITDKREIAPIGWHLPTEVEIKDLLTRCGTGFDRVDKLISPYYYCIFNHIIDPNHNLDVSLGGYRDFSGSFKLTAQMAGIWSSTFDEEWGYGLFIFGCFMNGNTGKNELWHEPWYNGAKKNEGYNIRCIMDYEDTNSIINQNIR